jgi:hypothetical protein
MMLNRDGDSDEEDEETKEEQLEEGAVGSYEM